MGEKGCCCGKEQEDNEEISMEDLVEENNFVMNCLIDLLIEKNVITDEELEKKMKEVENKFSKEIDKE